MKATTTEGGLLELTTERGAKIKVRRVRRSEQSTIELMLAGYAPPSPATTAKMFELVIRLAVQQAEGLKSDDGKELGKEALARKVDPLFPKLGAMASVEVYEALDMKEAGDVFGLAIGGLVEDDAKN